MPLTNVGIDIVDKNLSFSATIPYSLILVQSNHRLIVVLHHKELVSSHFHSDYVEWRLLYAKKKERHQTIISKGV